MNYYISDLHLFHNNAINFDNRPYSSIEEMNTDIVKKWNSKITNADTVYILGDVSMKGNVDETIALVSQLKGAKVLIVGNHDKRLLKDIRFKQLFKDVVPYIEIQDSLSGKAQFVALSHYPILMWNGQHRGAIHLYGHVHNSTDEYIYQDALKDLNEYYRKRDGERYKPFFAYNVGCMHWGYEPVTLAEIIEGKY